MYQDRSIRPMRCGVVLAALMFQWTTPTHAADRTPDIFRKKQLTSQFWSEAAAIGDLDRNGHADIVVGPFWYSGPDFTKRHAFYPATHTFKRQTADGDLEILPGFDGISDKVANSDMHYVEVRDLNGDGWLDILAVGLPEGDTSKSAVAYWYENPKRKGLKNKILWTQHLIADQADNFSVMFVDLKRNGRPVLLCVSGGRGDEKAAKQVGYLEPQLQTPEKPWTFHPLSAPSKDFRWSTHGLGYGDINGDNRADVLHSDGWWEQPQTLTDDPVWTYHPFPFHLGPGQIKIDSSYVSPRYFGLYDVSPDGIPTLAAGNYGGSQMYVDDLNGDGLADVVTSIAAHGYGLVWWEQLKDRSRFLHTPFRRHIIINKHPNESKHGVAFSELQAVAFVDVDADGLKDIVTGKRWWSHGSAKISPDPEADAPAVLYWFKQVHNADKSVDFVPQLIDDNSGAGAQIAVGNADGNGLNDIVVTNKKGAFVFFQ